MIFLLGVTSQTALLPVIPALTQRTAVKAVSMVVHVVVFVLTVPTDAQGYLYPRGTAHPAKFAVAAKAGRLIL